jgi:hypothetical protein
MRSVWRQASTGQVVTRPGLSRDVWLPAASTRSTNSPVQTTWTRMPDAPTGHRALDTGHWTPGTGHRTSDTRHRTPDTGGHRDTGHRTPDTGHRTPDARTPDARRLDTYRTPDTGRADAGHADVDGGRGQGDQGTVGIGGHHDAAETANLVAVAAAAHAAFGNHDGSAVRPPASARDCRLHCQAAAGSLRRRPAAPRRTAVLGRFGSRVERAAKRQVLWRVPMWGLRGVVLYWPWVWRNGRADGEEGAGQTVEG